jgi:hypothetical protein
MIFSSLGNYLILLSLSNIHMSELEKEETIPEEEGNEDTDVSDEDAKE